MGLGRCRERGKGGSAEAVSCPHCGVAKPTAPTTAAGRRPMEKGSRLKSLQQSGVPVSRTGILILILAALLLTPPLASAESRYRMLVNHGTGWSEAGDFSTLEECKGEAAVYAIKHSVQASCAAISALEQQRAEAQFQQVARFCAGRAGVQIALKPGRKVDHLGTTQQRFDFDKCMAERGQPTESAR